jgi:predicted DNA-binding mobile mystery protein A
MTLPTGAVARRSLDARFERLKPLMTVAARPPRGWVRAVREALGMSTAQFARRLGVAQPSVVALERSEAAGRIQLDTLRRAAEALDCTLVYALVPNRSLDEAVRTRAREIVAADLAAVEHSMRLEDQAVVEKATRARHLDELAKSVDPRTLWD